MTIYQFFFIIILVYLVYNIKHEYNLTNNSTPGCYALNDDPGPLQASRR